MKLRDAKIEQARMKSYPQPKKFEISESSQQYLPEGYKGPVRGYY